MCGLAGFIDTERATSADDLRSCVRQMSFTLQHRGPDDEGHWVDPACGVAFGFRRLAILDLTENGHQPMTSASGRYTVMLNGEIYNFEELRSELLAYDPSLRFRGHSDTEVLLAAFERWGVIESLPRCNGMFAVAAWDRETQTLTIARDRFGEKPLYYGWAGKTFLFASELKAFRVHPSFAPAIDRDAVALHLRYNCIPYPKTIYQGIHKLPPAGYVTIRGSELQVSAYWSAAQTIATSLSKPFTGSDEEAIGALDQHLRRAVKMRMVSDVPLGAFLSGGIDSSMIVALMQAQSDRPVKTFTIGFDEAAYNEADDARAVAAHLGTAHTELYVSHSDVLNVIPRLAHIYDEPFADSSQIPTFLVSQLARQKVTVSLSGDGGDELFGGYNRHTWGRRIWSKIGWTPTALRKAVAAGIHSVSPAAWNNLFTQLGPVLPGAMRQRLPGYKLHKLADVLPSGDEAVLYTLLTAHWSEPQKVVLGASDEVSTNSLAKNWPSLGGFEANSMLMDVLGYLPNDILVKLDRAAMAVSLEGRVPFLDPDVFSFAWRLPLGMKIRNGHGKWILRQLLDKYVPRQLFERPKMGFGIPIDGYLRGPLRGWAEELLGEKRIREDGLLAPELIRERWSEHLTGRKDWQYHIWDVLMLQSWLDETRGQSPAPKPIQAEVARS
jgi:asparagine synthase (glutamine-hydrolysing)